ncbi:c-type cytochrome [Marinihelvus fidelis]|uniref:C-type cytochrome n=1 Tax=Marinihelvus fidelis TaxID=2613842 RepID=A0A5N0TDI0_9GAMM|nr:cytochrome c [Marinihelvus fidelis]KAA9132524.1 c-type cytochrome [Marinihelvus fidelis]
MKTLPGVAVTIVALVAMVLAAVYVLSERALRDVQTPAAFKHMVPSGAAALEHGRHVARTRGCFGCHGQQLQGQVFDDEWDWVARAVPPNLAQWARQHDLATFEAVIRHGVGSDGRALWSMPSYNWVHLRDDDLVAMFAFLRSAPVVESALPAPRLGWRARWWLATGEEKHMAAWADAVPPLREGLADEQLRRGEYLAMTTCNECHGLDVRGSQSRGIGPPDLAIVAGYLEPDFRTLMREGVALGGRETHPLMAMIARDRFAHFNEQELDDLYAFLSSLPAEPVPGDVFWRSP